MHFEDKFEVLAPVDRVWDFITNPHEFVKVVPDLQKYEIVDEKRFNVEFKMGLGVIKGTVKLNFEFEGLQPRTFIGLVGKGTGLQSTADLKIGLNLTPKDGITLVTWAADLNVTGAAMRIGFRFIEPTTKAKVIELIQGTKREVERT